MQKLLSFLFIFSLGFFYSCDESDDPEFFIIPNALPLHQLLLAAYLL